MKMSSIVEGLCADAVSVGELGDDTVADVAERIAALLGRSAPGRILDVLSDAAAELTAELGAGHVEVRVAGDDVDLRYVDDGPSMAPRGTEGEADLSSRITLRLSEQLKSRVEEGAAAERMSVNTYILRLLERGVSSNGSGGGGRRVGNRLRGYGAT